MREEMIENKKSVVAEIADKMKTSGSTVIVEYRGLSVGELTELRCNLRSEGVDFKVYKNSLTQRAATEIGMDGLLENLTGPNAIAFSEDAVAPSRVLAKFAKNHDKLVFKAGIVDGEVVGVDTLKQLSSLPNREGMLSMLLSCLQSPVRSFACIVKAVADAKEENGSSEAVVESMKAEVVVEETETVETNETVEATEEAVEANETVEASEEN